MAQKYGKWIARFARQKYRVSRATSYLGMVNTALLLAIYFKITDDTMTILFAIATLSLLWVVGMADDRLKVVHAESNHGVEATTPYFQTIRAELEEVQKNVEKIKQMLEERK